MIALLHVLRRTQDRPTTTCHTVHNSHLKTPNRGTACNNALKSLQKHYLDSIILPLAAWRSPPETSALARRRCVSTLSKPAKHSPSTNSFKFRTHRTRPQRRRTTRGASLNGETAAIQYLYPTTAELPVERHPRDTQCRPMCPGSPIHAHEDNFMAQASSNPPECFPAVVQLHSRFPNGVWEVQGAQPCGCVSLNCLWPPGTALNQCFT